MKSQSEVKEMKGGWRNGKGGVKIGNQDGRTVREEGRREEGQFGTVQ